MTRPVQPKCARPGCNHSLSFHRPRRHGAGSCSALGCQCAQWTEQQPEVVRSTKSTTRGRCSRCQQREKLTSAGMVGKHTFEHDPRNPLCSGVGKPPLDEAAASIETQGAPA